MSIPASRNQKTGLFTSADVAYAAAQRGQRITADGIRAAAAAGRLSPYATTQGGVRLFTEEVVDAFLEARRTRQRRTGSTG
jgi:hypothetical protein